MNVTEGNKWDIRWLKSGDSFTLDFEVTRVRVEWRRDHGYLALGDGLYVRCEPLRSGDYECERRRYPAGGVPEYSSSWFLGLMV